MTALWHYTCDHGHQALLNGPTLLPGAQVPGYPQERLDSPMGVLALLSWMTDLEQPDADALGLTMRTIGCDRTRHRWRVLQPDRALRWGRVRSQIEPWVLDGLELKGGAQPVHWWVSQRPIAVEHAPW